MNVKLLTLSMSGFVVILLGLLSLSSYAQTPDGQTPAVVKLSTNPKDYIRNIIFLCCAALLFVSSPANTAPFAYSVDRIEVTGNIFGSLVDEFDDGVVAPWEIQDGTVTESGGLLTFSGSGAYSESRADSPHNLVNDGAGNFTVTSTWLPVAPSLNESFGMIAETRPDPAVEDDDIEVGLVNLSAETASLLGLPAGLSVFFAHYASGEPILYPISSGDITGHILLEITFDDDTDLFSGGISLDDGDTFIRSFPAVASIYPVNYLTDFELGATRMVPVPVLFCEGFEPPLDQALSMKKKSKRAVPVKMILKDSEGTIVNDTMIAPPVVEVAYNSSTGSSIPGYDGDLLPAGLSDDGNEFRYDPYDSLWVINLGLKAYTASGEYTITAKPGDDSYLLEGCSQTITRNP